LRGFEEGRRREDCHGHFKGHLARVIMRGRSGEEVVVVIMMETAEAFGEDKTR